jgi:hypothetical protein
MRLIPWRLGNGGGAKAVLWNGEEISMMGTPLAELFVSLLVIDAAFELFLIHN